jgi:hypothetical protein
MSEIAAGRILIDGLDDPEKFEAAQSAALEVERHIAQQPQLVSEVLEHAKEKLDNPSASSEWTSQLESDNAKREVALAIANLLHHTSDGKYLAYDDESYDAIDTDSQHRHDIIALQKSDRRNETALSINRRRVALSGLSIFVKTWGNRERAEANADEVA